MPASGEIKLVDANAWLAFAFSDHVHHGKAKEWFDGQANDTCAFCRVTQMALLRHLTGKYGTRHSAQCGTDEAVRIH